MQAHIINQDYSKQKDFYYFLCSDLHFANKGQNKKLLKEDFDEARRLNARIFINGDWGDFIMPGDKKRYTASGDPFGADNHINQVLDEVEDFLKDYADLIEMIGTGNHEVSVSKFNHFDPTQQLIYNLNRNHGAKIRHGQYSGYIILKFIHGKNGSTRTFKIYYNHGQGSTAEITKGAIDLNRHMSNKICDLCWLGHKHTKIMLPSEHIMDVDRAGQIFTYERAGIITGAYLNVFSQYDAMKTGYKINYGEERMRSLQSTGGAILKINLTSQNITRKIQM